MYGREELNWHWSHDVNPANMVYLKIYADKVMDAMEARINELEAEYAKLEDDWQKTYAEECVTRHENHALIDRIEELETELRKQKGFD